MTDAVATDGPPPPASEGVGVSDRFQRMRVPALPTVLFADASDVTREVGRIRLNVPHLSVGPGIRYLTPVGPFRLDIGYRVPGAQAIGTDLTNEGGTDVSNLFGVSWLPVSVNIALGEAF